MTMAPLAWIAFGVAFIGLGFGWPYIRPRRRR